MAQELVILSPEKTVLTFRIAGIGSRAFAHLLDWLIIFVALLALSALVTRVFGSVDMNIAMGSLNLLWILGPFLYFILLEGLWNGQTVGKKLLQVRVRMADGTPVRFWAAIGRNLLRPADFLPLYYFAGLLSMFTSPRSQRLGDMVASTIVIHERKVVPVFQPAPHRFGVHPLESRVGDLRKMTEVEYAALKRYCDRFPELSPAIQGQTTNYVWTPFAIKHGIATPDDIHPIYLAEAAVMKYGRTHGLL